MILKAKHHFIIHPFFKFYTKWKMKNHFSSVHVDGRIQQKKAAVLLVSNHVSWWDGFWAMYLNLTVFKRKFHFMMLKEQLKKYWFFNYTGGFSVNKKSKSIIETINYAGSLLDDPENMVLIFPQGELQSLYEEKIIFESGLERIIEKTKGNPQIIFNANLVDYFSLSKPAVYMYLEEFHHTDLSTENMQKHYNRFYKRCIEKQKQKTF